MKIFTSVVQLQPGLYVLRHPGGAMPPLSVATTPGSRGEVHTLTAQSQRGMILENDTDCIVMRVDKAHVDLLIAAYSEHGAAVVPAMKIDRIALGGALPQTPAPATPEQKRLVIKDKGISLVGHVERHGDVVAGEGEMLGRAGSIERVEGFQVMWPDRPEGVDIAYNVVIEGIGVTPVAKSGQFVGTRREAKRVSEVTFALIGPNASRYQLTGTACFSGGFQIPLSSGAALSGPSGMEHLTGLTLKVVPASTQATPETTSKAPGIWDASPRTKVFSNKTSKKTAAVKTAASSAAVKKAAATKQATSAKSTGSTASKAKKA